jgi:hypothetical protein
VALHHLLLDGVELAGARDAFHADDLAPGHEAERNQAAIDGAVAGSALRIAVDDSHRARAAVPLGTALFRTRQTCGAQVFEQGDVRGNVLDADTAAIEPEFDGAAHNW